MILLSEAVFKIGCRAAEIERPDVMLALGLLLTGQDHGQGDADTVAALVQQAGAFRRRHQRYQPLAAADTAVFAGVFNDLYRPNTEMDDDGLLHIRIPVPEREPLTSELLGMDWRIVGLAWFELGLMVSKPDRVVVEALRPTGPTVYAMLRMDCVAAFEQFLAVMGIEELKQIRIPNASCPLCSIRSTCRPWKSFLDAVVGLQIKDMPAEIRAHWVEHIWQYVVGSFALGLLAGIAGMIIFARASTPPSRNSQLTAGCLWVATSASTFPR